MPEDAEEGWAAPRARGRRVNKDFEGKVMAKLVVITVRDADKKARADKDVKADPSIKPTVFQSIIASCMLNYSIIKLAAVEEQKNEQWKDDKAVQTLQFSDVWVNSFIRRFNFSRQAITKLNKSSRPSVKEVQERMAAIQKIMRDEGYELCDIFNMDETPGIIGLNPKFGFAPKGSGGVSKPDNDERQRITINVGLCADGSSLPASFIIKCTTDNIDQSDIRVIESLHKQPDFNEDAGWGLGWWSRTMEIKDGPKKKEVTFKRPYLKHKDGRVIWAQVKAYQDTPGLAMWCDLVMGPARVASGSKKWLLVWDQCSAHLVASVTAVFEEWSIFLKTFPPNMTDFLQPVDLAANGPLKAHAKRARAKQLYDYFQNFAQDYADAITDKKTPPEYRPPVPTLSSFISLISGIFATHFTSEEYMAGVRRCFVSVGLAPKNGMGAYVSYESHARSLKTVKQFRGRCVAAGDETHEIPAVELLADITFMPRANIDWSAIHRVSEGGAVGFV